MQRRRFLIGGLATVAASVAAGVGLERIREVMTEPASGSGTIQPYISKWVAVATLAEVTPGEDQAVLRRAACRVWCSRSRARSVRSARCARTRDARWCPRPPNKLVCPCHPMSFNLTGAANPGDYRLNPLPAIQTRVNAGSVEVLVPDWI